MQTSLSEEMWKAPTVSCFRMLHCLVAHVATLVRLELALHLAREGILLCSTSPDRHPVSGIYTADTESLPDETLQLCDAVFWSPGVPICAVSSLTHRADATVNGLQLLGNGKPSMSCYICKNSAQLP